MTCVSIVLVKTMTRSKREDELEHALDFLAWVIELHGDAYWPIFLRLEADLETLRSRNAKLKARRSGLNAKHQKLRPLPRKTQKPADQTDVQS